MKDVDKSYEHAEAFSLEGYFREGKYGHWQGKVFFSGPNWKEKEFAYNQRNAAVMHLLTFPDINHMYVNASFSFLEKIHVDFEF